MEGIQNIYNQPLLRWSPKTTRLKNQKLQYIKTERLS